MKKLLAIMLALIMVLAMVPAMAEGEMEKTVVINKAGEGGTGALETTLGNNPVGLDKVTTLVLKTADGVMLTIDDITYIKDKFIALTTLDLTDADFIDNQGDGKNASNWIHPWKNNTEDINHQFPDCAFLGNKKLETVIFGSKIKSIGAYAFSNCTNLKEIKFVNSSLEAIDKDAFRNTAITYVAIPNTVNYMGDGVFYGTKLTTVRLPDSLTRLSYSTFGNCSELISVDLNKITEIGGAGNSAPQNAVFFNCNNLKVLRLPATLETLGGSYTSLVTGCSTVVDLTACPAVKVGDDAFRMFVMWDGKSYSGSALVYVQKATENIPVKNAEEGNDKDLVTVAITNGGIFPTVTQFSADQLATPVRPGYNFAGWYTTSTFDEDSKLGDNDAIAVGSTYYAQWTAKPIMFKAGDGEGTMPNENYTVNQPATDTESPSYSISFPECAFTAPDGQEFAGWKITEPDKLVDNTVYPAGGEKNIGKEAYANVTVTAQWKAKQPEQQPSGGGNGGGYYHPTPTPVPVIVIPPKTGDMTVWQSILHFLGIK